MLLSPIDDSYVLRLYYDEPPAGDDAISRDHYLISPSGRQSRLLLRMSAFITTSEPDDADASPASAPSPRVFASSGLRHIISRTHMADI
jgi:hypothetical protein